MPAMAPAKGGMAYLRCLVAQFDDSLSTDRGNGKTTRDEALRRQMGTGDLKNYFTGPDDPDYCVEIAEPTRIELFAISQTPEVWEAAKK